MREYKLAWYHANKEPLSGEHKNQNTDKTHCTNGHEFTPENTKIKTQDGTEHRTCLICHREDQKNRARKDMQDPVRREPLRQRRRKGSLKRIGWTPELFDKVWEEQDGKCAIPSCRKVLSREVSSIHTDKAYADHEHISPPKPRGILCLNCNLGLGNLQENVNIMEDMIFYVKKHKSESGGQPSGPQSLSN
jgi:hypothetical protein